MIDASSGKGAARRGGAVIAAAVVVALAGWAAARLVGIELTVGKGGDLDPIEATEAAVAAVVAGLAAWGTSALLARNDAARWWPFVGSTALAVSMVGPSYLADGSTAMALTVLHLMVGAVLIGGFALAHRDVSAECSGSQHCVQDVSAQQAREVWQR